jgi:hypothetical protein
MLVHHNDQVLFELALALWNGDAAFQQDRTPRWHVGRSGDGGNSAYSNMATATTTTPTPTAKVKT